jgi:hypothetical protein
MPFEFIVKRLSQLIIGSSLESEENHVFYHGKIGKARNINKVQNAYNFKLGIQSTTVLQLIKTIMKELKLSALTPTTLLVHCFNKII